MATRPDPDLVGVVELASRAGVRRTTVHAWRARHDDFPDPVADLAMGPVWRWSHVQTWLANPRPTGRHKT